MTPISIDTDIEMMRLQFQAEESQAQHYERLLGESGHETLRVDGRILMTLGYATNNDCPESLRGMYAGYMERGFIYIGGSVAKHFYQLAQQNRVHSKDVMTEAEFRDRLADAFKIDGWQVETEHYTSSGRIDIVAKKDGETRLVECKLQPSMNEASHALGQLLFYSKYFPGASLWFASPQAPDEVVTAILKSYGVAIHG